MPPNRKLFPTGAWGGKVRILPASSIRRDVSITPGRPSVEEHRCDVRQSVIGGGSVQDRLTALDRDADIVVGKPMSLPWVSRSFTVDHSRAIRKRRPEVIRQTARGSRGGPSALCFPEPSKAVLDVALHDPRQAGTTTQKVGEASRSNHSNSYSRASLGGTRRCLVGLFNLRTKAPGRYERMSSVAARLPSKGTFALPRRAPSKTPPTHDLLNHKSTRMSVRTP